MAPVDAAHLAVKPVAVMVVAAAATGATGAVLTVTVAVFVHPVLAV